MPKIKTLNNIGKIIVLELKVVNSITLLNLLMLVIKLDVERSSEKNNFQIERQICRVKTVNNISIIIFLELVN